LFLLQSVQFFNVVNLFNSSPAIQEEEEEEEEEEQKNLRCKFHFAW